MYLLKEMKAFVYTKAYLNFYSRYVQSSQNLETKKSVRPSTGEWITKLWYTYRMEYYSTVTKEQITDACSNREEFQKCYVE